MSAISGRTLYVHIGLPKTASSWLQQEVFPRLGHLHVRSKPRNHALSASEPARQDDPLMAQVLRRSSSIWDEAGEAILSDLLGDPPAGCDVLVSDETIGRAGSRPEHLTAHLRAMADLAGRRGFARFRIAMLVRRQDHWLASHYAQMSDRRIAASQSDFDRRALATIDPARDRDGFGRLLDYHVLWRLLVTAFGADAVFLQPMERLAVDPERGLGALLAAFGTPVDLVEALPPDIGTAAVNRRSEAGTWRLRPATIAWRRLPARIPLPRALTPWRAAGITMPDALSRRILASYRPGNEILAGALGLDLGALGYFPDGLAR